MDKLQSMINIVALSVTISQVVKTAANVSICCVNCGEDNKLNARALSHILIRVLSISYSDCPKQLECEDCVGVEDDRICSWGGDHCSAVCVGEYCWDNGKCPHILIYNYNFD